MSKAIAINGSPQMEKGNTAMVLTPFIQGMMAAGADVELFYASRLQVKPCACGEMYCWYRRPGECCIKDDMQLLYPKLKAADILILATPVYIPLPGDMQDIINRLCPLFKPLLETRQGRTRGRFHEEVRIQKIVLISTGGWWEIDNFGTVLRIAEELAEDASVDFAGAVLRPHAFLMKNEGQLTEEGESILNALKKAGSDLIEKGAMSKESLEAIRRPLIPEEELRNRFNQLL